MPPVRPRRGSRALVLHHVHFVGQKREWWSAKRLARKLGLDRGTVRRILGDAADRGEVVTRPSRKHGAATEFARRRKDGRREA